MLKLKKKLKTQGKTQNSRGKILKLKEKILGFGKFYYKVENKCQIELVCS